MKNISLTLLILFAISIFIFSCDATCPPADDNYANIHLKWEGEVIYNETLTKDDNGTSTNVEMPDGSEINLTKFVRNVYVDPNEETLLFGCLVAKSGFYSMFPDCGELEIIDISCDTDFIAPDPDLISGIVYNNLYGIMYNSPLNLLSKVDSTFISTIPVDINGRYSIDLELGEYLIGYDNEIIDYNVDNYYHDIELVNVMMDEKPNIYLYPEEEMQMDVIIVFPKGGTVTVSDPAYGKGWMDIKVTPEGKINGKHDFLFYECATSEYAIPEAGWVIAQTDLKEFFTRNLEETGFVGREIVDFIEFWIPKFKEHKFYEIYPLYQKELDEKVVLNLSKKPDSMQRLTYIVKGRDDNSLNLEKPAIPAFERKGFVVTEWGVIRK